MTTLFDPSNSVVHLQFRREKCNIGIGSGVLYKRAEKTYIVTAWHNVTGRHTESLECISKYLAIPDNVVVTVACKFSHPECTEYMRRWITVPLEIDGKTTYYVHKQGFPRVDVVAIPIDPHHEYISEGSAASGEQVNHSIPLVNSGSNGSVNTNIEHIQDAELSASSYDIDFSQYLYVSDDVFILGYPKGITDNTGQPIWKRASVATSPRLGWNQQKKFLVDCASKDGMSGASVIFYDRKGSIHVGNTKYETSGPATVLHGIYVGRLGSTSEFEAQIGYVWQRTVIDEIIDCKESGHISEEIELPKVDITNCIKNNWSDAENYAKSILDENCHYIDYFVNHIMALLNGRANPSNIKELVKEYASQLLKINP